MPDRAICSDAVSAGYVDGLNAAVNRKADMQGCVYPQGKEERKMKSVVPVIFATDDQFASLCKLIFCPASFLSICGYGCKNVFHFAHPLLVFFVNYTLMNR